MVSPTVKRDGFHTVGHEISAGTWESNGTGDRCYWAVLDDDQDIMKNHYGDAGGRVKIPASAAEFETKGCGTWIFQG